jgi:hypothetical protein
MWALAIRPGLSLSSRSSIVLISGCCCKNSCSAGGSFSEAEIPPSDSRHLLAMLPQSVISAIASMAASNTATVLLSLRGEIQNPYALLLPGASRLNGFP